MIKNIIGIDISQEKFDVYCTNNQKFTKYLNDKHGIKSLIKYILSMNVEMVIFEPTNKYHRLLEERLHEAKIAFFKVTPTKMRHFAKSKGQYAKTDKIDAKMLAIYGVHHDGETSEPISPIIARLQEKFHYLMKLTEDRTAEVNRLKTITDKDTRAICTKHIETLESLIAKLDKQMMAIIKSDAELYRRYLIMVSVKGVGIKCAFGLLACLPELGQCDEKQIAALVGVAPISRESGQWKGKSFIGGGRKPVRLALYMPAISAIQHNQVLKNKYQDFIKKGKAPKVAITAIIRKLIILINALVRKNQMWSANHS